MKKILVILSALLLLTAVGCAKKDVPETTESPAPSTTADNGATDFLKGNNPDFLEKFAE